MSWDKHTIIRQLDTVIEGQLDRYEYLEMRYANDVTINLRNQMEYKPFVRQFSFKQDNDLLDESSLNVIKSVIDSIVSKLANQKVRPYFNTINGNYKTKQAVRKAQHFFDVLFDNYKVNQLVSDAFKGACKDGIGYLYICPKKLTISTLPAWEVALLNTEMAYGSPTKMMIKQYNFPTTLLSKYKGSDNYVTRIIYIDTEEHLYEEYINYARYDSMKYTPSVLPIIPVYYNKPAVGTQAVSLVEDLNGIQQQIDLISAKMANAAQLTSANTTYVIEGSNLKPSDISNRVGQVYGVKMPPGVNTPPVVNVAPAPFDPSWAAEIKRLTDAAYEMVGVSQLSAQSKKPSGVESGVALQTMQDVESDRFETQITHYVQIFVDLVKLYIDIVPEDQDILSEYGIMKWKEIKDMSGKMNIQYSSATALSKEPSEKLKQLMQLSQTGLINPAKIAMYLDTPDMEEAYKGTQAVYAGINKTIEDAIDNEVYDIPEFINYKQLAQEIAITENELFSSKTGDKKGDKEIDEALERVQKLENRLLETMQTYGYVEKEEGETTTSEEGPLAGLTGAEGATEANDITSQLDQQNTSDLGATNITQGAVDTTSETMPALDEDAENSLDVTAKPGEAPVANTIGE